MAEVVSSTLVKVEAPEIRARLAALKENLIRRALAKGIAKARNEIAIRDISPLADFGLANDVWTYSFTAANTWENMVQARDVGDKVIGIIGLRNDSPDPKTVAVRFGLGWPLTIVRGQFHIQAQYLEPQVIALFSKDIIFEKGEKFTVSLYGRATGADGPIFLGLTAEAKGVTVSE